MSDAPLILPRLPLRSLEDLAACAEAEEIHSDRCAWMGSAIAKPCTCGVLRAIRAVAAVYGDTDPGGE